LASASAGASAGASPAPSGVVNSATSVPTLGTTYVVKKGDTLYAIAVEFSTTVAELKRLNDLTSNSLNIGQKLQIP
jgi:LysM repeat protein